MIILVIFTVKLLVATLKKFGLPVLELGLSVWNHHSWVPVDKRSLFVLKVLFFCF